MIGGTQCPLLGFGAVFVFSFSTLKAHWMLLYIKWCNKRAQLMCTWNLLRMSGDEQCKQNECSRKQGGWVGGGGGVPYIGACCNNRKTWKSEAFYLLFLCKTSKLCSCQEAQNTQHTCSYLYAEWAVASSLDAFSFFLSNTFCGSPPFLLQALLHVKLNCWSPSRQWMWKEQTWRLLRSAE